MLKRKQESTKGGAIWMNRFPVIGISGSISKDEKELSLPTCYTHALLAAGAIPVLLSPSMTDDLISECLSGLDGVFLIGGNDVAPERYGHDPVDELGEVSPLRDDFECRLVRLAVQRRMPVLGICRGIQSLNVAMGGTLWQDISSQYRTASGEKGLAHSQRRSDFYTSHRVLAQKGTLLDRIIGRETFWVNSFHHQAVREAAPGMAVSAYATDGLIEAIEYPELPFCLGVQWHPERYFERDETSMAIFRAFAEAAKAYQNQREFPK